MAETRVYELPFTKFAMARALLRQSWFDEAYIDMVLEGVQPGRIFVDSLEQPSTVLLCHWYEFYVAGDSSAANPMRQFIKDNPAEPDVFHTLYGYCGVGEAWDRALLEDANGQLKVIPRRCFKYRHPSTLIDWRAQLPPNATIQLMDADLAQKVDDGFYQRITGGWGTIDAFLKHAFGHCLLVDGGIASVVDVVGSSAHFTNFGVFTTEAHRSKGYASLVCSAAIEHTLMLGKMPTWDCDGHNTASGVLALKLGFSEDTPFSQLSPERGTKLPLSNGLWAKSGAVDDIIIWSRNG